MNLQPQPTRRTLARGVVWSTPAIAAAMAAPAIAASLTCTTLATSFSSGWAYQNPATGTLLNPGSNRVYSGTDGAQYYMAMTTATSPTAATVRATGSFTAVTTATTTSLRAGCTYTVDCGLTAVPNTQGTSGHQVLTIRLLDPSGATVPGSLQTYTTATGVAGRTNVPYTTVSNIRRTLTAPSFTFTAVAGTYRWVAEFTTPTNYGNSTIYATGLGFSAPKFTAR